MVYGVNQKRWSLLMRSYPQTAFSKFSRLKAFGTVTTTSWRTPRFLRRRLRSSIGASRCSTISPRTTRSMRAATGSNGSSRVRSAQWTSGMPSDRT